MAERLNVRRGACALCLRLIIGDPCEPCSPDRRDSLDRPVHTATTFHQRQVPDFRRARRPVPESLFFTRSRVSVVVTSHDRPHFDHNPSSTSHILDSSLQQSKSLLTDELALQALAFPLELDASICSTYYSRALRRKIDGRKMHVSKAEPMAQTNGVDQALRADRILFGPISMHGSRPKVVIF